MPESGAAEGAGLVFAGGCPRSGLTLLRRILAIHPGIRTGPDTGAAPAAAFQWRQFADHLGGLHREFFDLDDKAVAAIMGRFLEGVLRAESETRLVLEKTSLNVVAFENLARMLPGARFIHVVRDGRDVAASLLDRNWRDPASGKPFPHVADPQAAMTYWTQIAAIGLISEQTLAAERRLIRVRYEDMASAPAETAGRICDFLGLAWPPAKGIARPLANQDYAGLERESLPLLLGAVTPSRIGRWRARFSPAEAAALGEIGRAPLAALGYLQA